MLQILFPVWLYTIPPQLPAVCVFRQTYAASYILRALGDYRRFAELDVRFHSLLSRATGNQVAMIVTDVLGQVEQHTLLKKMETLNDSACLALERRILARHREILSAIHRQDDAAAKQAMREHTRAAATDLKV